MGNWNITIRGVGFHHNGKSIPEDANRLAAKFVRELKEAGHQIDEASFTCGSADDIKDPDEYLKAYEVKDLK